MKGRRLKVAFVVQRYGLEVNGGSEYLCRSVAERMSKYWDIEVLTSRAMDHVSWADYYPPGTGEVNGIKVTRFGVVSPREIHSFSQYADWIFKSPHSDEDEDKWVELQGPNVPGLIEHIDRNRDAYDMFIFFTYLYYPTIRGLPLVKEKAIFLPTAHDEPPAKLRLFYELYKMPKGFAYLTEEEREFVHNEYRNADIPGDILGMGINKPGETDPVRFRQKYGIEGDYILYCGRVEPAKGCAELLSFFNRYRFRTGRDVKLLFIGRQSMPVPESEGVRALGFIDEQDKHDGVAGAELIVLPSYFESFSIIILEAWIVGRPVLVKGDCAVLKGQARKSRGGLYYSGYEEFEESLNFMLDNRDLLKPMGEAGRKYVLKNYSWPEVEQKYLMLSGHIGL